MILSKTAAVLDVVDLGREILFSNGDAIIEDSGDIRELRTLSVSHETWLDLGSPKQLTVTIEPGDKLNEVPFGGDSA